MPLQKKPAAAADKQKKKKKTPVRAAETQQKKKSSGKSNWVSWYDKKLKDGLLSEAASQTEMVTRDSSVQAVVLSNDSGIQAVPESHDNSVQVQRGLTVSAIQQAVHALPRADREPARVQVRDHLRASRNPLR